MIPISPIPYTTPIVITKSGPHRLVDKWMTWLREFKDRVDRSPDVVVTKTLTAQDASLGATVAYTPTTAGLFRVTYIARISRAAGTSSSLTVTIGWTRSAVACALSGSAMTGNTTATVQSNQALVRADANTSLTFSTTYASVGAPTMQYEIDVIVERL